MSILNFSQTDIPFNPPSKGDFSWLEIHTHCRKNLLLLRQSVFLTMIILFTICLKVSFAQNLKDIPLTPFKGGIIASPSDTNSIRLQKYLQIAAENNPALRAGFYHYLAALQKAPQVGALPNPKVMFGYFISPIQTRLGPQTSRISVTQMFPWFGTLAARKDAAVLEAKARFADFQDHRNRLFYQMKKNGILCI